MVINRKKYRTPFLLLIFGIAFCIISGYFSIDATEDWFGRSGAVLSFVSVAIQFILSDMKKAEIENLFNANIGLKQKFKVAREKDPIHDFMSAASTITGLVGTIIWGYGDLFL
ncbi:hypothetical protein [Aequorivita capsosiphonis]|uniref:hypothetical protein n=1 Tax=Aequorivita capsosiphonis TaxID=487317 RepID=UPI0003FAFA31|nr:hypothetical protein [Aequorivita capsosiphonis]